MTYAFADRASAADDVIWLALSESGSGAYAETAEAARRVILAGGGLAVETQPWQQFLSAGRTPPRLVIAIGSGALAGLADSDLHAPVLATLLPRSSFERLAEKMSRPGHSFSAIFLDQPAGRQIELLKLAMPDRRRVGVLLGPESKAMAAALRRATAERGMTLATAEAGSERNLFPLLRDLLDESDVLLALPDPQVFNGQTIQNILTAAYRRGIPLAGFSPAYIRTGALLSLYSTPAQIGAQAGEIARAVMAGRPLPAPQGPRNFTVGVNGDVARSLGISIAPAAAEKWVEQIRAKEHAQ